MTAEELLEKLRSFAEQYADDTDWEEARAQLPADWPI